jgi:hypothetical protein
VASLYSLVYVFECKRILRLNALLLLSVMNLMFIVDHCTFLHKSSICSPFYYYDSLFGVYQDLTRSCMPGLVSELGLCCFEFPSI